MLLEDEEIVYDNGGWGHANICMREVKKKMMYYIWHIIIKKYLAKILQFTL
jgi:hypothetical protein